MVWLSGILRPQCVTNAETNTDSVEVGTVKKLRPSQGKAYWNFRRPSIVSNEIKLNPRRSTVRKSIQTFSSHLWTRTFHPQYQMQVVPLPVVSQISNISDGCENDGMISEDVLQILRYVQGKLTDMGADQGITRFDFLHILTLAPDLGKDLRHQNALYRSVHSCLHLDCCSASCCRITSDDFDAFWVRRDKERKYREFAETCTNKEDLAMAEGLIQGVETRTEWPDLLELMADCCIDTRPVSAFRALIHENGLQRIWMRVRSDIAYQGTHEHDEDADRFRKLLAWWSFLCCILKDAFKANEPGEAINSKNLFYDQRTRKLGRLGSVSASDVLQYVWTLYHPRQILFMIGAQINDNSKNMETVVKHAWQLLDLGALEFLMKKQIGGVKRLRTVLDEFTSFQYDLEISAVEGCAQLENIMHCISKLDSMLKAAPTFCYVASLYGTPLFLELIEWWIRRCSTVIVSKEAMTMAWSIISSLQPIYDRMENYICLIYQDEHTDETSATKAKEAYDELHSGAKRMKMAASKAICKLKLSRGPKKTKNPHIPQDRMKSLIKLPLSESLPPRKSEEMENAWSLLLRSVNDSET